MRIGTFALIFREIIYDVLSCSLDNKCLVVSKPIISDRIHLILQHLKSVGYFEFRICAFSSNEVTNPMFVLLIFRLLILIRPEAAYR